MDENISFSDDLAVHLLCMCLGNGITSCICMGDDNRISACELLAVAMGEMSVSLCKSVPSLSHSKAEPN